jgi:hypothetical protein
VDIGVDLSSPQFADADGMVRFGLANVRLVSGGVDYYPIGTLGNGLELMQSKPDDYQFVNPTVASTVVFVFVVDPQVAISDPTSKQGNFHFVDGSFLQFKRFARAEVGDIERSPARFIDDTHFPGKVSPDHPYGTYGGLLSRPWVIQNLSTLMRDMPGAQRGG